MPVLGAGCARGGDTPRCTAASFFQCKKGSCVCCGAVATAGCSPEKVVACFCYLGSMLVQYFVD